MTMIRSNTAERSGRYLERLVGVDECEFFHLLVPCGRASGWDESGWGRFGWIPG